jgi:hypothetical protein
MNPSASIDHRPAELALRALGIRCTVEERGQLAVVIPAADERALEEAENRRAVVAALRALGFTHTAVELPEDSERPSASDAPSA